FSTRQW
ncbi:putative peptidoglycan binding domain protein, partial [Vibrio cholerae CP1035(8)]